MREQRWPWWWAATLMLAAGAAAARSTYLHWLPCRGSMFNGTMFRGYDYGPGFSDACSRRLDTSIPFPYPPEPAEQTPWASELGIAAFDGSFLRRGAGYDPRSRPRVASRSSWSSIHTV